MFGPRETDPFKQLKLKKEHEIEIKERKILRLQQDFEESYNVQCRRAIDSMINQPSHYIPHKIETKRMVPDNYYP